jgi:membrane protein YdbS with pleckstrin-like domain
MCKTNIEDMMYWISDVVAFTLIALLTPVWIIPFWCYRAWRWNKDRIACNNWLKGVE